MKPETPKSCSNVEKGLNRTRSTRHAIRRTSFGLKCSSCQRSFPSAVRLRRHLNFIHKNAGKIFCCKKCNITFDDLSVFLQHSREHESRRVAAGHDNRKHEDTSNENIIQNENDGIQSFAEQEVATEILEPNSIEITDKEILPEETRAEDGSINGNQTLLTCSGEIHDISLEGQLLSSDATYQNNVSTSNQPSDAVIDGQTNGIAVLCENQVTKAHFKDDGYARKSKSKKQVKNAAPRRGLGKIQQGYGIFNRDHQRTQSGFGQTVSSNTDIPCNSLNIGLPQNVKTINLMSMPTNKKNQGQVERAEIISYLDVVNKKLDSIIRHFNVPCSDPSQVRQLQPAASSISDSIFSIPEKLESFHNQTEKLLKKNSGSPSMVPYHTVSKTSMTSLTPTLKNSLTDDPDSKINQDVSNPEASFEEKSQMVQLLSDGDYHDNQIIHLSQELIEKLRSKSLNRGNFAKHLVFKIFPPEERSGRNCFGRKAGLSSGPKAPLDPHRLQIVRDVVFQHYPCEKDCEESIWRRECVVAIDTGLRGENRTNLMKRRAEQLRYLQ